MNEKKNQVILELYAADLKFIGCDTDKITDSQVEDIVSYMEDYFNEYFAEALRGACDYYQIPINPRT